MNETSKERRWLKPLMLGIGVFLAAMPFLFWYQTWFGRQLSARDIGEYLHDAQHPRRMQHALTQMSHRIVQRDSAVKAWYPRIVELSRHPQLEMRSTAAWVMGQDNSHEPFRDALTAMLRDSELMVRRNAALSLVRFGAATGKPEIVNALRPLDVPAPSGGAVSLSVRTGQDAGSGTLLARVGDVEVRSPYAGTVGSVFVEEGARVESGARLLKIGPNPAQVWESLRALYLIGGPEDLGDIERLDSTAPKLPEHVRRQAVLTAQAIRNRSARTTTP